MLLAGRVVVVAEEFDAVAELLDLDILRDAVAGGSGAVHGLLVPGLVPHALLGGVALVDLEGAGMLVGPERVGEEVVAEAAHEAEGL